MKVTLMGRCHRKENVLHNGPVRGCGNPEKSPTKLTKCLVSISYHFKRCTKRLKTEGLHFKKFLTGIYFCGLVNFFITRNKRKLTKFCWNKRLMFQLSHAYVLDPFALGTCATTGELKRSGFIRAHLSSSLRLLENVNVLNKLILRNAEDNRLDSKWTILKHI